VSRVNQPSTDIQPYGVLSHARQVGGEIHAVHDDQQPAVHGQDGVAGARRRFGQLLLSSAEAPLAGVALQSGAAEPRACIPIRLLLALKYLGCTGGLVSHNSLEKGIRTVLKPFALIQVANQETLWRLRPPTAYSGVSAPYQLTAVSRTLLPGES
jgi:hypothetical protein